MVVECLEQLLEILLEYIIPRYDEDLISVINNFEKKYPTKKLLF